MLDPADRFAAAGATSTVRQRPPRSHHRRDLLIAGAAALVGGGAAIVATSGGGTKHRARPQGITAAQADVALLESLLAIELRQIAAYSAALPHLRAAVHDDAGTFLVQEQQHADALRSAIADLGATVPGTPAPPLQRGALAQLSVEHRALDYLAGIEREALNAYSGSIEAISTEDARVTAAAILATEAEHLAVLTGGPSDPRLAGPFAGIEIRSRRR